MKGVNLGRTAMGLTMAALVVSQAFALDANRQVEAQQSRTAVALERQAQSADAVKREIVVSLADRKLALLENGKVVRIYRVAVGKASAPSPTGTYTIANRVENPTYYHRGEIVQPGPGNPVGNRWMGLNVRGYGIHGTNLPSSIGKAASHGCIRLGKADIDDLFGRVRIGDTVEIVGTRDTEIAQIFGNTPEPLAVQSPLQNAKLQQMPVNPAPTPAPAPNVSLAHPGLAASATSSLIGAL